MNCLHCDKRPQIPGQTLCEVCINYPRCEGCQVIFGEGFSKPSSENPNRCDSCLHLEDFVDFFCAECGKPLPLFYSPNTNTMHYVVRGNFCGHCNNGAAIEARRRKPRDEEPDFVGYLELMSRQLMRGVISDGQFEFAKLMNPHDINNPSVRVQVEEELHAIEDLVDEEDE